MKGVRGVKPKISENIELELEGSNQSVVNQTEVKDGDRLKELERELKFARDEKQALLKQLEDIEYAKKGISKEKLETIQVLSKKGREEIIKRIEEYDKILAGKVDVLGSTRYKGEKACSLTERFDLFQDKETISRQKARLMNVLNSDGGRDLTSKERDYLTREKLELEAYLKKRIASVGDEWDTGHAREFNTTVNNLVKFNEDCTRMTTRLRNINKILEPDNNNADRIDYLYKDVRRRNV